MRLKRTWTEPAVIWAAIVGKSGTHKTPSIATATDALQKREAEAIANHKEKLLKYEHDRAIYERNYAGWKRDKQATEPPPWEPKSQSARATSRPTQ